MQFLLFLILKSSLREHKLIKHNKYYYLIFLKITDIKKLRTHDNLNTKLKICSVDYCFQTTNIFIKFISYGNEHNKTTLIA